MQNRLKAGVDIPLLSKLGVSAGYSAQYLKSHKTANGEDVLKAYTTHQFEKIANNSSFTPEQKMEAMNKSLISDTKSWNSRIAASGATKSALDKAGKNINGFVDKTWGAADGLVVGPAVYVLNKFDPKAASNLNNFFANNPNKNIAAGYNLTAEKYKK